MQTELRHTYSVPLKKGFDYLVDFNLWPHWYAGMIEVLDADQAAWSGPGDEVRFAYKLLGRRVEGKVVLDEYIDGELVRHHSVVAGLPDVAFTYAYAPAGFEAFILKVTMDTEEPDTFFGKAIDRMLLPRVLARDLRRSLENLDDIFMSGMLD